MTKELKNNAFSVSIYIAGDIHDIRRTCRAFCMEGLCVTITPTSFMYTNGCEEGARIGVVNYPRFPSNEEDILQRCYNLAKFLLSECFQSSVLIDTKDETIWLTTKEA